ncbi:RluA family pseudouridine synthase [Proteiniclasticum ruminis]|jgi:23S rRNA pseudouridine1911/1915/1917 synthase|uniref:Pseudouridine synthase n=1 Tax=Proteiniclasticum ruminis TaxID=398199 RepID=A0A1G8NFQ7_9CLOT|nr:RluA family pseudouridine synthase [Proteiniclasticum ruminis]SDI78927.1 23S rRNA pseudouridine1911/1915/1917 synthase [Proteiniclasticum ruminis]
MNNRENLQSIEKNIPLTYVGEKIKTYLKDELGLSTRFVRSAALSKRILINGKTVKLDYILREEDQLRIHLEAKEHQEIEAEEIPIHVVYEDDAILVLNKEPYMVVHPTKSYQSGTLSNAVMHHYKSNGKNTIIRLVSRLDMNTSGLIILAKNQFVHSRISQDMQADLYEKYYVAIVKGAFPEETSLIDLPIYRDEEGAYQRVVDERGQRSLTEVKVLHYANGHTLLLLKLLTGRTHQIRVHLSHLGYPIIGDELYGGDLTIMKRQALHAVYLSFRHPVTEEKMSAYAEVLEDFKEAAQKIGLHLSSIENEIAKLQVVES